MRKYLFYFVVMQVCIATTAAYGQVILDQNFATFADSSDLSSNAPWRSAFGGGTIFVPKTKVRPQPVKYNGYFGSDLGKSIQITPDGDGPAINFAPQTTGSFYVSFSIKISDAIQTAGNVGDFFRLCGGGSDFSTATRIYAQKQGVKIRFGIDKNSAGTQYTPSVYDKDTAIFVVLKYTINAGTNDDAVKLFVNKASSSEPAIADLTNTTGTDIVNIDRLIIRANSASTPTARIGRILISRTWAEANGNPTMATQQPTPPSTSLTQLSLQNNQLRFVLSTINTQLATCVISDVSGKMIHTQPIVADATPTPHAIALPQKLAAGVYIVSIINGNGVKINQKIIAQ